MKKLLLFLLVISSLVFVGCGGKQTISPPTVTAVRQEGLDVYVDFNPLHNPYTPEFSLDGEYWYSPTNFQNNSIIIFTFNTDRQRFVAGNDQISVPAGEITVYIREPEGPDTLTTEKSNGVTYTLTVPNS